MWTHVLWFLWFLWYFKSKKYCLQLGNPKTRKPETGMRNRNPESWNHKSQKTSSSNLRKLFCIALPVKNKRPSKKSLNLFWNKNFPSVKIRTAVIPSEGYGYENLNQIRRNTIPSTLRGSKIIIALTRNNCCTKRLKKVKFQGFFSVWPVTVKYFMLFVFPFLSLKILCVNHMMHLCGYFFVDMFSHVR